MAKKKSKKINWGGGAGFYDPSDKTTIHGNVKNEQYKKSLEKKNTKNNNKSSESPKNTPTAKSGGGSSSTKANTKPNGIQNTNKKMEERSAKIAENHQKLYEVNPFKSSNKSVNKAIHTSIDQNAMRNGNKTSDADAKAKIQNEVFKQKRAELEKSVNNAKTTVSNAVKKQAQTVKENFIDSELRQRRLNENSQANIDLADAQTALSRNGQVDNPTWKNKKTNKINLNDATQVSKLNKKATESSETIQKNLDRNALLGVIADTNASYVKGVENAVSSGLQAPANALATVGRMVANKNKLLRDNGLKEDVLDTVPSNALKGLFGLDKDYKFSEDIQNKMGGFAQDMYNATSAAEKAMQDNNSVYSNAIGQTFSSVGNMLPQTLLGLSGVGKAGTLGLMASNIYGSKMSSAMNNYMAQNNAEKYSDVSNDLFARANMYALESAGKEVLSEILNKVIPGYEKLNINDIAEEGLEEVFGGVLEPYINQILTANNPLEGFKQGTKELGESIASGDLAKQGIMGSASALLANAPYSIADTVSKAKARSENNKFIQEHGTETEKNFGRVVSDYNLAKENYGITKNDTSKSIIDKTQYNINHDNGVLSDYMVNNSNETFRKYARDIQAEAIRNAIGSERTNQQTNAFIKSVNDNNLAVEFADNVNVNGEKVFAKLNGDNGITFDNSVLKDKSINLDETLRQTLEKGYSLKSENVYVADKPTPSEDTQKGDVEDGTLVLNTELPSEQNGLTNEQKEEFLKERKENPNNAYQTGTVKPSDSTQSTNVDDGSLVLNTELPNEPNGLTNEQKEEFLKERSEHPEYAYQNDAISPTTKAEQYGTDTIDLGTDPNGMTNEQKNQVLSDRRTMYEQGMNAFRLRNQQERADFESDRQSAQDLNERAKKASETNNASEMGNVLREAATASEETKQAVKETVSKDNKKAVKEATGIEIDDNLAKNMTDIAEDIIGKTKAFKGIRDAAEGKHGENAEQRANAKQESESSSFRYESTKDADTFKSAKERISAFEHDGKLDVNSSNEILKDITSRQDTLSKTSRKNGYLSAEHQYEQAYVIEATNKLSEIENDYRTQLEKQGYEVTRSFEDDKVKFTVKDADGKEVKNELTKALETSAQNAADALTMVLTKASADASYLGKLRHMWKAMPKEQKFYNIQKLVQSAQSDIDNARMNKNGKHILKINDELLKAFDSAENNSEAQIKAMDDIVMDLASQTPRSLKKKINAWRNSSMLASLPTTGRNIVGNGTSYTLLRTSNIFSTGISKALDSAGYFQKAELDLTDAKGKYYYDYSAKVVSNTIQDLMKGTENTIKPTGKLAKDLKKWKGGADNVKAFLNQNADFKNRLQHNVGTKLSELAKQEGALTKSGNFSTEFIKNHSDEINKIVCESYNESAKSKALLSENSFIRQDGTIARVSKENKKFAKDLLEYLGGEEGATGSVGGRLASGYIEQTDSRFDLKAKYRKAIQEETFKGRNSKILKALTGKDVNVGFFHNMEKQTNWLLNNAIFGDTAFFRMTYTNEFARYIDARGYTGSIETDADGNKTFKFTDKNGNVLNDAQTAVFMDKANKYCGKEAKEAVFHQESMAADAINKLKQSGIIGEVAGNALMAFAKTPINIARNSVTYSPIGLMKGIYELTEGVQSGRYTADEGIRHMGKGMTGSMLVALGALLFTQGILNGATGDSDKDKFEEKRGKQPYSLNLPNGTYSLSAFSVANVPLFLGANVANIIQSKGFTADQALDATLKLADPLVAASYMSGFVESMQQFEGETNYDDTNTEILAKYAKNVIKAYLQQFIPSFAKHITTVLNKYKKSTYDEDYFGQILNNVRIGIPFLASSLQNQVDVYGNDVENVGGDNPAMRALYTYLSIGTYKPYDKTYGKEGDSYTNKLEKIAEKSGDSNVLPYVSSSIQGTKMNAEERHDLNQYMLKNYNNQVHSLFESGILDGYNLNNKEDATQVAELLGKIKSHYFYEAKAKLYKRTNPTEASSVLTNSTKATQNLAENGIPVFLTKYLQSQPSETDSKGASISISKPLRNRRLLETLGLYDNVMDLYKEGKITDLYNVGLSKPVAEMSQQEYEYKLDDLDNGLIEGSNTTSDLKRRHDTYEELEENQKFADALTAHDIDYGTFANYKTIKPDKKDGKTVYNSRAKKIIAQMEEDGVLEGFKEGIRDGSFNYDNIIQFGLTSKQVEKLLGLKVQKTSDDDDSSSGSSSSDYSRRSRRSSRRSSGSRRSSSRSSSSSATAEETPTFDISGALKAINKGASKTSSGLTQSQLQSLYNSTVSNHNSRISQLQTLVNKGKK